MSSECYKYLVFWLNNGRLIRDALSKRPYWKAINEKQDLEFEMKFENNKIESQKCDPSRLDTLKEMKKQLYTQLESSFEDTFIENKFHFCWRSTLDIPKTKKGNIDLHCIIKSKNCLSPRRQLVNHFPHIKPLTTKSGLLKSLLSFYSHRNESTFMNIPLSFYVDATVLYHTKENSTNDWQTFQRVYNEIKNKDFSHTFLQNKYSERNLWIVKPTGLNCGRGIMVFDDVRNITDHIRENIRTGSEFVIQKYIERPLLIHSRKFDIRIWSIVNENFDIYLYHEGYLRTSSEVFTLDISSSKQSKQMVHLTNYCMQVKSDNLGKFEEGNTLSFAQFQEYLDATYPEKGIDVYQHFLPRMRDLVIDTILSTKSQTGPGNEAGRHCFALYGYDFMIDEDFRLWLIEVNTNPYLGVQNPWHQQLLENMGDDLVEIAIDPIFPPPPGYDKYINPHPNKFDLIYSDDGEKQVIHTYLTKREVDWLYPTGHPESYPDIEIQSIINSDVKLPQNKVKIVVPYPIKKVELPYKVEKRDHIKIKFEELEKILSPSFTGNEEEKNQLIKDLVGYLFHEQQSIPDLFINMKYIQILWSSLTDIPCQMILNNRIIVIKLLRSVYATISNSKYPPNDFSHLSYNLIIEYFIRQLPSQVDGTFQYSGNIEFNEYLKLLDKIIIYNKRVSMTNDPALLDFLSPYLIYLYKMKPPLDTDVCLILNHISRSYFTILYEQFKNDPKINIVFLNYNLCPVIYEGLKELLSVRTESLKLFDSTSLSQNINHSVNSSSFRNNNFKSKTAVLPLSNMLKLVKPSDEAPPPFQQTKKPKKKHKKISDRVLFPPIITRP